MRRRFLNRCGRAVCLDPAFPGCRGEDTAARFSPFTSRMPPRPNDKGFYSPEVSKATRIINLRGSRDGSERGWAGKCVPAWKSSSPLRRSRHFWKWYRCDFQDGKKFTRTLRTRDRKIAEQLRQELEVKLRKGQLQTTTITSIAPYFEMYKKDCHYRARSTNAREFYEAKKFIDFIGKRTINSITQEDVRRYLERYQSMAPKTFNGALIALGRFFRPVVEREYTPPGTVLSGTD